MEEKLQDFEKKQNLQTETSQLHALGMNQSNRNIKYRNELSKFYPNSSCFFLQLISYRHL